jgi:hypothetical protein
MLRFLRVTLAAALVLTCCVSTTACKKRRRPPAEVKEEGQALLISTISMADPRAGVQLLNGFYDIEQNAWRWTAGKFSVALRAPGAAPQKGADLVVKFTIPDAVLGKVQSQTLNAKIGTLDLAPETYRTAGEHEFRRAVPASAFAKDVVTVDFALDKFLKPGEVDQRELGLIMAQIGLETK